MIDDGWAPTNRYGDAAFNTKLFPNMKGLLAKIHEKGFKTLLWTTPYRTWHDDLGVAHTGPKVLELANVPLSRLPYFERITK